MPSPVPSRRVLLLIALGALALLVLLLANGCGSSEAPVRSPLDDRGTQPTAAIGSATFPPPFGAPFASPTTSGSPSPSSTPAGAGDREAAVAGAIDALAGRIGLGAARFTLDRVEAMTWPDGCLGVEVPGLACTQVITPGYRVVLRFETGSLHEVRTGRPGQFVWTPQVTLHATIVQPGTTLTLDAAGKPASALVGPGARLVDVTVGALKAGDHVVLGADDLRDGSPLRVAWLAREP